MNPIVARASAARIRTLGASAAAAIALLGCAARLPPAPARGLIQDVPASYDVVEKSLAELAEDLAAKRVTSEQLVVIYTARIRSLDAAGPELRSVIGLNPRAIADAKRLDAERAAGRVRGPLHGIPILIKDNIETADPLPTTAGSLALSENFALSDAPIVTQLRAAGAVVLGKSNLSEWANIRSTAATSGWSAVGGLTKNPYALERNPCGSSSGSAVAVAANLAAAAIGTETNGSITCPSSVLGLVGLKPTLGLASRTGIIPISAHQDTPGPIARSVADAAVLLRAIAGSDPRDPATREASARASQLTAAGSPEALAGRRFGILAFHTGYAPKVDALFDLAVRELKKAGAEMVVVDSFEGLGTIEDNELALLLHEFRSGVNAYLAATPASVRVRSLADVIAFNRAHAARELSHFGQELFERAESSANADPAESARLRETIRRTAAEGLDRILAANQLDALIAPTLHPAWVTDLVNGDHVLGSASLLPAVAGYPHLTVPMGAVQGLPVGLSFIGAAWSDAKLLELASAYERRTRHRRPPPLAH